MRFSFAAPSTSLRTCFAPLREIFQLLIAAWLRYFNAGITQRAKRSMDLRTLS
jgi:hypothetical protein